MAWCQTGDKPPFEPMMTQSTFTNKCPQPRGINYALYKGALKFNGLMQKKRNSITNALELHLFCIKP